MRTLTSYAEKSGFLRLPIHVELFEKLGFELPVYCHTAQLMKIGEDGNKRKLSKRKDPELHWIIIEIRDIILLQLGSIY